MKLLYFMNGQVCAKHVEQRLKQSFLNKCIIEALLILLGVVYFSYLSFYFPSKTKRVLFWLYLFLVLPLLEIANLMCKCYISCLHFGLFDHHFGSTDFKLWHRACRCPLVVYNIIHLSGLVGFYRQLHGLTLFRRMFSKGEEATNYRP